jgi:hypothetical protein
VDEADRRSFCAATLVWCIQGGSPRICPGIWLPSDTAWASFPAAGGRWTWQTKKRTPDCVVCPKKRTNLAGTAGMVAPRAMFSVWPGARRVRLPQKRRAEQRELGRPRCVASSVERQRNFRGRCTCPEPLHRRPSPARPVPDPGGGVRARPTTAGPANGPNVEHTHNPPPNHTHPPPPHTPHPRDLVPAESPYSDTKHLGPQPVQDRGRPTLGRRRGTPRRHPFATTILRLTAAVEDTTRGNQHQRPGQDASGSHPLHVVSRSWCSPSTPAPTSSPRRSAAAYCSQRLISLPALACPAGHQLSLDAAQVASHRRIPSPGKCPTDADLKLVPGQEAPRPTPAVPVSPLDRRPAKPVLPEPPVGRRPALRRRRKVRTSAAPAASTHPARTATWMGFSSQPRPRPS